MTDLNKLLGPMARRLGNMVARGKVLAANSLGKLQILQLGLLAGETKDRVEHLEPFGFTAKPLSGAEHVTLFLDGDRSHGVTIVVADRRYRLQGLQDGEVALYNAHGHKVVLGADYMELVHDTEIRLSTPLVKVSQNMHVAGTVTADVNVMGGGKSLAAHTHPNGTPNTGTPN
jgi:phage gp45-like